ncbi:MAG TPA: NUDIX domain-containing protein [Anaeromyxobacteraceae bacterium]|nr:NUDIX domain-containing protein [Anaeromyxobacteraceae bacterium]
MRAPEKLPPARREALRSKLMAWWDAGHRALPWRFPQGEADPYRVWLAEVMLQQTQVAAVLPYYRRFVARFPSLEALAEASEEEVLAHFDGLGYYARGRRLLLAAREAVARHGGLPGSAEALRALPGFGSYTAGAVASIAFGERTPCVDGNVARVLSRIFLVEGAPELARTRQALWGLAGALVPARRPGDFNQALMELGATVCRKPAPRCERCPVRGLCRARRGGRQGEIPPPRSRRSKVLAVWACAVLRRRGAILLARRPAGLFGGLWALPSAAVACGEDPRAVLRRELGAAFQLEVRVGPELHTVERLLTRRRLRLTAYECRARTVPPRRDLALWPEEGLGRIAVPAAMRRLLAGIGVERSNPPQVG